MARKGQFKKGGGRVGDGRSGGGKQSRARKTAQIVHVKRSVPAVRHSTVHHVAAAAPRPRGGRRRHRSDIGTGTVIATALIMGNTLGTNNGILGDKLYNLAQKIPGAKTFGNVAVTGAVAGALYKWTDIGKGSIIKPILGAMGIVGAVAGALKFGEAGTSFKWLGGDSRGDFMDVQG